MSTEESRNVYLDQVVAQQEQLQQDLRARRPSVPASLPPAPRGVAKLVPRPARTPTGVEIRITGWWRWRTVVVPPNAFVVHTRRGRSEPLRIGLGESFRYNPATDSFLVVPGAMQTILINAYCICRELQGVVVQAYVQWIIDDFAVAYRRLDFADPEDPMRLVNLQLQEQAEAAIKDTVATMGIDAILSDKQPIVAELTARLRGIAEGGESGDRGLGLRIVTVQIKEAVVSSARLWENLQRPYRSEQTRIARLAEVAAEEAIAQRELAARQNSETQRMASERELADLRSRNDAATFDREADESARRVARQQEDARRRGELENETRLHAYALERSRDAEELAVGQMRLQREHTINRLQLDGELELAQARGQATHEAALLGIERDKLHAEIDNEQSPARVQARLIESLPDIVSRLPKPTELRAVTVGSGGATTVSGLLAELAAIVTALRSVAQE